MRSRVLWFLLVLALVRPLASFAASTYPVSTFPSATERAFWRKHIKTLMLRPGCCGSCPALVPEDFRRIAQVIRTDARDSQDNRQIWERYSTRLARIIDRQDSALYHEFVTLRRNETSNQKEGAFK